MIDEVGRVPGLVQRAELLMGGTMPVGQLVDPVVTTVNLETPLGALLPVLSSGAVHEALVVDGDGVLAGIITQTDLLTVVYRAHIVEAVVSARPHIVVERRVLPGRLSTRQESERRS